MRLVHPNRFRFGASSKDRPRIDAFVVPGVTIIFVFASGMWVWTRCAKSVLASTSLSDRALKIDTLAVAVCVALLEHPYAFLWLSANTTSEDNNRSGRHQQSTKTNKPIFSLARVDI
jgi:hypothetical protein